LTGECQIRGCPRGADLYCFYTVSFDGKSRTFRTYKFCELHGNEIRNGQWEAIK